LGTQAGDENPLDDDKRSRLAANRQVWRRAILAWWEDGRAAVCEIVTANAGVIGDTGFTDGLPGSRTLPKPPFLPHTLVR
jgi:hypothetical protein